MNDIFHPLILTISLEASSLFNQPLPHEFDSHPLDHGLGHVGTLGEFWITNAASILAKTPGKSIELLIYGLLVRI
jgi:hypothetical protein